MGDDESPSPKFGPSERRSGAMTARTMSHRAILGLLALTMLAGCGQSARSEHTATGQEAPSSTTVSVANTIAAGMERLPLKPSGTIALPEGTTLNRVAEDKVDILTPAQEASFQSRRNDLEARMVDAQARGEGQHVQSFVTQLQDLQKEQMSATKQITQQRSVFFIPASDHTFVLTVALLPADIYNPARLDDALASDEEGLTSTTVRGKPALLRNQEVFSLAWMERPDLSIKVSTTKYDAEWLRGIAESLDV
jgi:hypothetical protein